MLPPPQGRVVISAGLVPGISVSVSVCVCGSAACGERRDFFRVFVEQSRWVIVFGL